MLSLWPVLPFVPDQFVIDGTGELGSGWGMFPLVVLGTVTGWSATLILFDLLRGKDKFWHAYDHVWYATGLLAGIFFVADSNVGGHARALQESTRETQQASTFLLKQAATYDQWCHQNGQPNKPSCRWASRVQQTLLDYSTEDVAIFVEFGPKSSADVYHALGQPTPATEIEAVRNEITAYNQAQCPVIKLGPGIYQSTPPSTRCQNTPATYCRVYPDPLNGKVDKDHLLVSTAFASECIVPTLVVLRAEQEKLIEKVKADQRARHYRWMYYLLFSLMAGGKIANATTKLAAMSDRPLQETRRSLHLVQHLTVRMWHLLQFVAKGVKRTGRALVNIYRRISTKPNEEE